MLPKHAIFRFAPYILRTLLGHGTRSLLTVSGAAVAIFVFYAVSSVQDGLRRLTEDEQSKRTLIVFQENRFCPASSRLPQNYAGAIQELSGVRDVMPMQVWTNNCRASLDVVVFNGVPPQQLRNNRALTLTSGAWDGFLSQRDSALVGRNVAARRSLGVGDQFSIGEISVKVAGVFSSTTSSEENLIYTHLALLQFTPGVGAEGTVTQLEVHLAEESNPEEVARAIDEKLKIGPVATTTRSRGAFQTSTLSDLVDLIDFSHWLGYACVGLVLSLVATTMVMSVQDRAQEHAVLQTIGLRPLGVVQLIVVESLVLCVVGGAIGTLAAVLALTFGGFAVGVEGVAISFQPSWILTATSLAVALAVGAVAGLIPALQTVRTSIVDSLRKI